MNKEEFLSALRRELLGLTPEERKHWMDYYGEPIDDAVEDGLSETEAVGSLGTVSELAAQIRAETPALMPAEPAEGAARAIPCGEERNKLVFPLPAGLHSLSVEAAEYDVIVAPAEDGFGRVECPREESTHVDVTEADGLVWIRQETRNRSILGGLFGSWNARLMVYLPAGEFQELGIRTGSGDVSVRRDLGFQVARIRTASGDIRYEGAAAILELTTASGDVTLSDLALHALRIRTASGDMDLSSLAVQETLRLESGSGDIELEDAAAGEMRLQTASGDIRGENVLARDRLCVLTASGDIELDELDTGSGEISAVSGDVELELLSDKEIRAASVSGDISVRGSLPGAGLLQVKTVSGDIRVCRSGR